MTLNFRLVSVLLILLLLGTVGFALYQYSEKARLASENATLKQQLDQTASQLRDTENQTRTLQAQLNATETKVTELEGKITQLEQNITRLETELKRRGYIAVALTFLWNPSISDSVDIKYLEHVVEWMNTVQWDKLQIYFVVYAAQEESYVPLTMNCDSNWGPLERLTRQFPLIRDIPIIIVKQIDNYEIAGCAQWTSDWDGAIAIGLVYVSQFLSQTSGTAKILTHEVLHAMAHITDASINSILGSDIAIPVAWREQIRSGAKHFQMPVASDESS